MAALRRAGSLPRRTVSNHRCNGDGGRPWRGRVCACPDPLVMPPQVAFGKNQRAMLGGPGACYAAVAILGSRVQKNQDLIELDLGLSLLSSRLSVVLVPRNSSP